MVQCTHVGSNNTSGNLKANLKVNFCNSNRLHWKIKSFIVHYRHKNNNEKSSNFQSLRTGNDESFSRKKKPKRKTKSES